MRLGSRGLREVDGRIERIEDDALRAATRRRARGVAAQSALAALAVTLVAWLLPA